MSDKKTRTQVISFYETWGGTVVEKRNCSTRRAAALAIELAIKNGATVAYMVPQEKV